MVNRGWCRVEGGGYESLLACQTVISQEDGGDTEQGCARMICCATEHTGTGYNQQGCSWKRGALPGAQMASVSIECTLHELQIHNFIWTTQQCTSV